MPSPSSLRNYRFQIPSIVAVGDLHFPFHHREALDWAIEQIAERRPEYVVQLGDLRDYYNLSRFARSLSVMTPEEEFVEGTVAAQDFWRRVQKAAPRAKLYQILGNHDDRAAKQLLNKCGELAPLIDLSAAFRFEGVTTIPDSTEELFLGDVAVLHGYKKHGEHARHNQCPTIVGHTHTGGVVHYQNRFGQYWELNAGFLGDVASPVFSYRSQKKIHGWTLGLGVVTPATGPAFVPYPHQ